MRKASGPRAAVGAPNRATSGQSRAERTRRRSLASDRSSGHRPTLPGSASEPPAEFVGFAVFAGYLVLAFTTSIPDQFALPKLLGLSVYVAFAAGVWMRALWCERVRSLPAPVALTAALLGCWWTVTTVTAQHPATALFGLRGRYNGLAATLAGLALFFFLATTRLSQRAIERRLGALAVALTVAAGYAVVQAAGMDPIPWPVGRPASTLGHPVIFGAALAVALPFSLAFALGGRTRSARFVWGGMALLQGLALMLTLARGPWLGALCGVVVLAAFGVDARRSVGRRLVRLMVGASVVVALVLAISAATRTDVFARLSTIGRVADDSSLRYRAHFCRAALAMWRDHPWVGVGLENFGLLYPRYRSFPTALIAPDLVPTMVHSGPLQTAVSGGIPALALEGALVAIIGIRVRRRLRSEAGGRARLLGGAFLAAGAAFLVQDLTGWPHVALGAIASVILGLGLSWSLENEQVVATNRWARVALGSAVVLGGAGLSVDCWRRLSAEGLIFQAQQLDVRSSWSDVEARVREALRICPDRAWVSDAAARIYAQRAAVAADRGAYDEGVTLTRAARAANAFDPYICLRRAEIDIVAYDRGFIARVTDEGRDALVAAKAMTVGSALVGKVEASLARKAGDSRILWMAPSAVAGFGPAGSLVVAGSAGRALHGTHVFLHWRNLTRGSGWITEADAPEPDPDGLWFHAIPNADRHDAYAVYSTSETWSYGPCAYTGNATIQLCSPLALMEPDTRGVGPPSRLIVAGTLPEAETSSDVLLHLRNVTRNSAWVVEPIRTAGGRSSVSFPPDVPGHWYKVLPDARPGDRYEAYVTSSTKSSPPCAYGGDGSPKLCSPLAWIQTQSTAGFGPPGSLVVGGSLPEAWAGVPVFLHWRNATRRTAWKTEAAVPATDGRGVWYNAIPDAHWTERYEVLITAPTAASPTCTYSGSGTPEACR